MSFPRVTITTGRGDQRRASWSFGEMYSDRMGTAAAGSRKRPIKDRLGNSSGNGVSSSWQMSNKRQRQEDSGRKRDMYDGDDDDDLMSANVHNSKDDLRYFLNRKRPVRSVQQSNIPASGSKDLREKLSGPIPKPHRGPPLEVRRQLSSATRGGLGMAHASTMTAAPLRANPVQKLPIKPTKGGSGIVHASTITVAPPRANPIQKAPTKAEEPTVASLLQALGLGKYLITFQAEEVDMAALRHMGDDDLKELGIPMGVTESSRLSKNKSESPTYEQSMYLNVFRALPSGRSPHTGTKEKAITCYECQEMRLNQAMLIDGSELVHTAADSVVYFALYR